MKIIMRCNVRTTVASKSFGVENNLWSDHIHHMRNHRVAHDYSDQK